MKKRNSSSGRRSGNSRSTKSTSDGSDLQQFAITLLLCAPSTLQDAWLKSKDSKVWEAELDKLKHVKNKKGALDQMKQLSKRKTIFAGIGELLRDTDLYGDVPPHPSVEDAELLLERLK